jgi:TP901 family phage tail tape measure protein
MDDIARLQIHVVADQVAAAERRLAALERQGSQTERRMEHLRSKSLATNQVMRGLGSTTGMLAGMLGLGVAGGLAGALGVATQAWIGYDKAMKEVNSLTRQSREEFMATRRDVLDLAAAIGIDAKDAASGLYQAVSAGIPRENGLQFLAVAAKTAVAGVTSVETAVDGLTNVINAYKMSASDAEMVADKMFRAVVDGKDTFEELAQSMSRASVPAANMGVSLDELLAGVVGLTIQGTPTAEAFTQIASAIRAMTDPSEEMQLLLEQMGYKTAKAAIQSEGFIGALNRIRDAAGGNDQMLVKVMGRIEGYNALLGLTGRNADTSAKALENLRNASGEMGEAYAANSQTLENSLNTLKASAIGLVETMENSLGVISKFSESLRGAAQLINELSGAAVSNATEAALNASGGAVGVNQIQARIAELEKLKATMDGLKGQIIVPDNMGGIDLAREFGGGLNWISGMIGPDTVAAKAADEIRKLNAELDKATPNTLALAEAVKEVNKAQEDREAGLITEDEFNKKREAALATLKDEQRVLQEKGALESAARTASEQAAAAEQDKARKALEAATKEKALAEEKNKELQRTAKAAQDLATTDRERLQLQIAQVEQARAAGLITDETALKAKANLEEQIKLLDEVNARKGGGSGAASALGGGSGAASAQGLESLLPEIYDPNAMTGLFEQEEQRVRESYERRRQAILEMTQLTVDQRNQLLMESEMQYTDIMRRAEMTRNQATLQVMGGLFENLASLANAFGKRGSKAAKALAIAGATVKMYEAAVNAYASAAAIPYIGWIMGPIAAASAIAAGAAQIAQIKATPEAGEYAGGGIVPGSRFSGDQMTASVNSGEMILNTSQQRELFAMANGKRGGGGNVSIVVNNNAAGVEVEQRVSEGPDGRVVELLIARAAGEAVRRVEKDVLTGGTGLARALENTYAVTRGRRQG